MPAFTSTVFFAGLTLAGIKHPPTPEHTHRDVFPTLRRLYAKVAAEHGVQDLVARGDSTGGQSAGTPRPAMRSTP